MNYFLAKTDPDTYSIDDFEQEGETCWDGVHNYQAINVIKSMKPGDAVYIYHSQSDKAIVGIAEVSGEPFENTADERFSWAVQMRFRQRIAPVTLAEMKQAELTNEFLLLRNPRLSTMPVPHSVVVWLQQRLK